MLESDIKLDNVKTYNALIPGIDLDDFNKTIKEVEQKALKELLQEGVEKERATLQRHLDMRYVGQHHEVTVDIPSGCRIEKNHISEIAEAFHRVHEKLYTYSTPENPLEIMSLRVTAVGAVDKAVMAETSMFGSDLQSAFKSTRRAYFPEKGGFIEVPVYDRNKLAEGNELEGPAIVEERITTVIVHPGWKLKIDAYGNIVMEALK